MNLNETVITNKTAKLAKNLGFDIPTIGYYIKLRDGWEFQTEDLGKGAYNWNGREGRSAPSQAVLQTWLRKRFRYSLEVNYRFFAVESGNGFYYSITALPNNIWGHVAEQIGQQYYGKDIFNGFTSYEEALEFGLRDTIKVLLNKD
jgi:hypothetical protein